MPLLTTPILRHPLVRAALCVAAGSVIPWGAAAAGQASAASGNRNGAHHSVKGPKLVVAELSHDFGTVAQGARLDHAIRISNAGNAPLAITAVEPACGCTTTGLWPRTLRPGETGSIALSLDTTRFIGPIRKTVSLFTDTPGQPETVVELNAVVWTPITVRNSTLIFPPTQDPEVPATRTTTLRNETDRPLVLGPVESSSRYFAPKIREIVAGKEFELSVATVPPLPDGTEAAQITIATSDEKLPTMTISAIVTVLPTVQVSPDRVEFYQRSFETAEKRFAVVQGNRSQPIAVSDLAIDAPGVEVTASTSPDNRRTLITLTFPPGFTFSPGQSFTLTGRTDHPAAPTFFSIPIVCNETVRAANAGSITR